MGYAREGKTNQVSRRAVLRGDGRGVNEKGKIENAREGWESTRSGLEKVLM